MTRITEALTVLVGKGKDAEEGVSQVGWMLPQSKCPTGGKLTHWGCVLWVGKGRIADSRRW